MVKNFGGKSPGTPDSFLYVYPEKYFTAQSWSKGEIPLWNSLIGCGTPHHARWQPAVFYLGSFLWLFEDKTFAWWLFSLAHLFWGGLGACLWLRRLRGFHFWEVVLVFVWFWNAGTVVLWGLPAHLSTLSWIPWVLWISHRLFQNPRLKNILLAVGIATCWLLGAYLPFVVYALFLGGGLGLHRLWKTPKEIRRPVMAAFSAVILGTAGLTALQWLPFLDFLGWSTRHGVGPNAYQLDWRFWKSLFDPLALGIPGDENYRGEMATSLFHPYLGKVGIFALCSMVFLRERKLVIDLFWLFFLAFFCMGDGGPLGFLLPQKIWWMLEPAQAFPFFMAWACWCAVKTFQVAGEKFPAWGGAFKFLAIAWLFELFFLPGKLLLWTPDLYRTPQAKAAVQHIRQTAGAGRVLSLAGEAEPGRRFFHAPWLSENISGLFPNANMVFAVPAFGFNGNRQVEGTGNFLRYLECCAPHGRVLDAAGVRAVLSPWELPAPRWLLRGKLGDFFLHENASAQPLVWQTQAVVEVSGPPAAWEAMSRGEIFLERELWTEKGEKGAVRLRAAARRLKKETSTHFLERFLAWAGGDKNMQRKVWKNGHRVVEGYFHYPGFLVHSEMFAPGWKAWVNGEPKPIFRAYGFLQAVLVREKGWHRVEFHYEPTAFRLGLFISLASGAAVLGAGIASFFGRRNGEFFS